MTAPSRPWLLVFGFIALYWAGGVFANRLIVGEESIVLLWPPSALALMLLIHEGRRWWPLIGAADLVFGFTRTDVPAVFVLFTMAANMVGALAASTLAGSLGLEKGRALDLRGIGAIALAGIALGIASAPFGVAGLVAAGFITGSDALEAAAQWLVANVFGVLVLGPAFFLLWPGSRQGGSFRRAARMRRWEGLAWSLLLVATLAATALVDSAAVGNAQALAALPTLALIWGAVRLHPRLVAGGMLGSGLALAFIGASDLGAIPRPDNALETLVLLGMLITLTAAPLIVMAAIGESRRVARDTLHRARTDPLTGLPNREGLAHRVAESLGSGEKSEPMALAFLDIDNFRLANDSGGQASGDAFLRAAGSLLRARLDDAHLIGRLAADQFIVLLRDTPAERVEPLLQRLLGALREYRHVVGDSLISTSASIGAIAFQRGQADYAELLRLADAACATAKDLGGNRIRTTDFEHASEAVADRTEAMRWAVRLDRALREDHFQLYCQSIVPLGAHADGRRHLEILLRMIDPETGATLPPAQFVAAAERFKMGPRLDRHVVDRTLGWFERNPAALAQLELCAINLCAASVNEPEFADFLAERFTRSSVPAERICLEITETSAVRDLADAQQFISVARRLGCKLALDDFGAGFCSFAYLRRLDVDFFKIDGSFVRDLHSSPLSLSIVRSIAEIARTIDKRTIAEFVEDETVRLRLAQIGVDFGQGYGIDRPMPIDQYFLRPAPVIPAARYAQRPA